MPTAADTLRTARDHAGITQAELSRRAGIAQSTISRIEHEEIDPTWSTMHKLLASVGWEVDPEPTAAANLLSAEVVSRAMQQSIRRGDRESAIRDLTEGVGRLILAGKDGKGIPPGVIAKPTTPIGSTLWETYLATAFAFGLESTSQEPPHWMTEVSPLPEETSPGDDPEPEFRTWLRARTPSTFLKKNILSRAEDWEIA